MGFANNRIAKIWEIKIKDKWAEVKLTTSKKDAQISSFVTLR